MRTRQNVATVVLAALLAVAVYGVVRTNAISAPPAATTQRRGPSNRAIVVDQSSLMTAEKLVRLPTTAPERAFAEDALRTADNEMDLAFAQAVRRTFNQPPATSPEAKEAAGRLQQALRALTSDEAQSAALTASLAKASTLSAESINDRLNLIKAQTALDQDEADDARQDLRRAGGDPQGRMQEVIAEHDAASKSSDSIRVVVTGPPDTRGLLRQLQALQAVRDKEALIDGAGNVADSLALRYKTRHDSVEARSANRERDSTSVPLSHDSSAAMLARTRQRAFDGKTRATLDQRVDNQRHLSDVYTAWNAALATQERSLTNRALRSIAAILAGILAAVLIARWLSALLGAKTGDRRMQTLYMATRVSLQVIVVLFALLVIFGPPDNLGTMIGLAGAGLTVALKDFILGFVGWFVLMGRNGIRIGDLVEINDVTGEVVELGMFYTVLIETGGWTESGHPTGRRVTFTNGYAIEGHYFNFSTSGRWLWDDVRIVVPQGRDPYPIAEALRKQVEEATAESARNAEEQWKQTWRSASNATPTGAPNVSLRPIAGGVEITVRFITRAADREEIRGSLYRTAVDLLGGEKAVAAATTSPLATAPVPATSPQ